MRQRIALLVWMTLAAIGVASAVSAQGVQTGTLRGSIVDQQDNVVPGATITLTSPALLGPRTAISDGQGGYVFRALPPGDYTVQITMPSFATVERSIAVPLGGTIEQNVTLKLASVTENVRVVADVPAPLVTPTVGLNIRQAEVEALATSRTLFGIATLSPGLNTNTPNTTQVSINGAFAFDNVFMLDGIDVNDNLFGSPQDLFVEDAIQETTVLTSSIGAEYGRFSGGVINAVTKSGGNKFEGSYRLNLTNPSWYGETPFEERNGIEHTDTLNKSHEATLGGYVVKDRLWFFSAGRLAKVSTDRALIESGVGVTQVDNQKRAYIKLTGSPAPNHTIQGGYFNVWQEVTNTSGIFSFIIDPNALGTPSYPNSDYFTNYRGILKSNLLVEAQYSQRKFAFDNSGGTSTSIADSPFSALSVLAVYNAPYFDSTDGERRNNRQLTGNVTWFVERAGRHEVKTGYEFFRSQDVGGNSQSATNYVFDADYVADAAGSPLFDANGRLTPIFTPVTDPTKPPTLLEHWLPVRGAVLNVDNNSFFAQDHWQVNGHVSADLGVRYERVRSEATGNIVGVDTDTIVPRLGVSFDPKGNGKYILNASYGHYSGRYNEAQVSTNSNVGNPDVTLGVYVGPAGTGRNFAPGLNPANYVTVTGQFPTQNVFFEEGLSSPITKEFTVSGGADLFNGRGYARASYIVRNGSNFIEDFIDLTNGFTDVERDGVEAGTFTNVLYKNTNDAVKREYRASVIEARYNVRSNLILNANWTHQFKNEGNYEGEAVSQPGAVSRIGDWPEAFNAQRTFPTGRLGNFQKDSARVWAIYTQGLGKLGNASISGLMRVEGAQAYSLVALSQAITPQQEALLAAYPDLPDSQNVYFGPRGSELFKGYSVLDMSVNYNIPVFKSARPFFKFDLFNALNNDKLIGWNTTVLPDPNSPTDNLGLATGYIKGSRFGQGTSNTHYPEPGVGVGLRGFRMSMGFRF